MIDINQIPVDRVLRYTNDDFIEGRNDFSDVITNGLVLDLSELTSDKEIFSYSIFYDDKLNGELVFEDSDIFMNIKHVDQIEVDEEYIIYFDFNTREIIMRYYIVGVKEFNKDQYLLTKIKCPYDGGWYANPKIQYNILAIEFYSYSGNVIGNCTQNIYNPNMDFKFRVDNYALVYINDEEKVFESFNVGFNKMSFSMLGNPLEDEEAEVFNKEFTEKLEYKQIEHEVDNVLYNYSIYFLWTYNLENLTRVIRVLLVNTMFGYNNGYGSLLGVMDYSGVIFIEDCICELKMFTKYGVEIKSFKNEDFIWEELIVNDGNEDVNIGYYADLELNTNVVYQYIGEP